MIARTARTARKLINQIGPMLHGKGPEVQAIVLMDLTASWVAGHHPELREQILQQFVQALRELIPHNEKQIFGARGWPTSGLN